VGEQAGLGAVGAAQLVQHPRDVALDPGFGQLPPGRDLRVGQALTEAGQHLGLAVGERPGQVPVAVAVAVAVYVFTSPAKGWSQQAELTASDGAAGNEFGSSVAVTGSTALIGAPFKTSGTGAAYVFSLSG
jgi:hypothetical protein